MTLRLLPGAAMFALAFGFVPAATAQTLQPGMRTMIQQGGTEPGPLLGYILPGPEEAERIFREDERWARQARRANRRGHYVGVRLAHEGERRRRSR